MIWGSAKLKKLIEDGGITNTHYDSVANPASVNVRLGYTFLVPESGKDKFEVILGDVIRYREVDVKDLGHNVIMGPGDFCLATTLEYIKVPIDAAAFVQGRSSIGRAGLSVQNAGFIDPGFEGCITLELKNDAPYPIILCPEYPVAQLIFMDAIDVEYGYSGKYVGQVKATGSRMYMDEVK